MIINKAYKFGLCPNDDQKELINKTIGYQIYISEKKGNTFLYNFALIKQISSLIVNYPFLKEVDSCALRCALFNLDNNFNYLFYFCFC